MTACPAAADMARTALRYESSRGEYFAGRARHTGGPAEWGGVFGVNGWLLLDALPCGHLVYGRACARVWSSEVLM